MTLLTVWTITAGMTSFKFPKAGGKSTGFEIVRAASMNFSIFIFVALLVLTGCKPKETTLSGQVFIVTKGAENVKLGAVEILLVEKPQVTDFLQKKQPAIDLGMASKRQELTSAEQEVATALGNADKAQAYFDWFTETKPYKTNANYFKADSEWTNLFKQYVRQTNYVNQLSADVDKLAKATSSDDTKRFLSAGDTCMAAIKKREELAVRLNLLYDQKKAIQTAAIASETEKLEVVKSSVTEANSHVATIKTNLDNSPTVADYLADFLPVIVQKTLSDSDGKFSFTYPRNKKLAIFAHSQRMVLDRTEAYYWLVDAPTNAETAQIFLSNNNLVFVDPDGYFKLKPKEVQQVLSK